MLIKWIVCRVPAAHREAFSAAQAQWGQIALAEGLIGQVGGWSAQDAEEAGILALWTHRDTYQAFLRFVHDAVTYKNEQAGHYEGIAVSLGSGLLRMPGQAATLRDAMRTAATLRVADCRVHAPARDRFVDAQATTWAPGMAAAPGMLGGVFSALDGDERRFLVTSLWRSDAEHLAYTQQVLPGLRERARPAEDLEGITGRLLRLEPAWTVIGPPPP